MKHDKFGIFLIGFASALVMIIMVSVSIPSERTWIYKQAYKQGQIDALSGKIMFKPKINQDTTWVNKGE